LKPADRPASLFLDGEAA